MKIKMLKPSKIHGLKVGDVIDFPASLANELVMTGGAISLEPKIEAPVNQEIREQPVIKIAVENLEPEKPKKKTIRRQSK